MNLYLIRGLPGVGKTTLGQQLVQVGAAAKVIAADDFFMVDRVYKYDRSKLVQAHDQCQDRCRTYLDSGLSVAVANTFMRRWELEPYHHIAQGFNIKPIEISIWGSWTDQELAARCVHGVPVESIAAMRARWEF